MPDEEINLPGSTAVFVTPPSSRLDRLVKSKCFRQHSHQEWLRWTVALWEREG
jgi:hypothetical protein